MKKKPTETECSNCGREDVPVMNVKLKQAPEAKPLCNDCFGQIVEELNQKLN